MRAREGGGITLLMALVILAWATAAFFRLHRMVVRVWALEGEALQGDRAALVADSALAWFLEEGWRELADPAGPPVATLRVPGRVLPGGEGYLPEGEIRGIRLGFQEGRAQWKLVVRGRLRPVGPGPRPGYLQERHAYLTLPRNPGEGGPVLQARRIVHGKGG